MIAEVLVQGVLLGGLYALFALAAVSLGVIFGAFAIANAGSLWGEYDRETEMFGLATPGGRVTTTGVGGFCLGVADQMAECAQMIASDPPGCVLVEDVAPVAQAQRFACGVAQAVNHLRVVADRRDVGTGVADGARRVRGDVGDGSGRGRRAVGLRVPAP
mgnify:CR=1 FL=1